MRVGQIFSLGGDCGGDHHDHYKHYGYSGYKDHDYGYRSYGHHYKNHYGGYHYGGYRHYRSGGLLGIRISL